MRRQTLHFDAFPPRLRELSYRHLGQKVTPPGSSWLNLVKRWFAELTQKKLKRGFQALERDIRAWLADWSENPQLGSYRGWGIIRSWRG